MIKILINNDNNNLLRTFNKVLLLALGNVTIPAFGNLTYSTEVEVEVFLGVRG